MSASNWGKWSIVMVPLLLAGCLSDFAGLSPDGSSTPRDTTRVPPPPPVVKVKSVVIHYAGPDTVNALGDSLEFFADALDSAGHVILNVPITWTSNEATVAEMNSVSGLLVSRSNGSATIRAAAGAVFAVQPIVVRQAIAELALSPDRTTLTMHETDSLAVVARDRRGAPIERPVAVTWNSSRPVSVVVKPDPEDPTQAMITRNFTGRTTITVTVEGRSASARID